MSEELIDVNIENIQIVRKVNPRNEKTAWRSQGEKYDCRPTNYKEYFSNYNKLHCKDTVDCEKCGKTVLKHHRVRHQKSLPCGFAFFELTQQQTQQ